VTGTIRPAKAGDSRLKTATARPVL
jgi:hypothetical protein